MYQGFHKVHTIHCICGKSFEGPRRKLPGIVKQAEEHTKIPHGDKGAQLFRTSRVVAGMPE